MGCSAEKILLFRTTLYYTTRYSSFINKYISDRFQKKLFLWYLYYTYLVYIYCTQFIYSIYIIYTPFKIYQNIYKKKRNAAGICISSFIITYYIYTFKVDTLLFFWLISTTLHMILQILFTRKEKKKIT